MKRLIRKAGLLKAAASSVAVAAFFAVTVPAIAQEAHYTFDIPAQDLDAALKQFGRTTKLQLVYDGHAVHNLRSYPLKGDFNARDGLAQLLEGSGFSMRVGQSGVLIIESVSHVAAQSGNAPADAGTDADTRGIADILVVGSRSQNSDVRRSENDAQPYVVFDQKDIQASQAVTLEDFFRTRVTSNTVQGSEAQRTSKFTTGTIASTRSTIDLRGLGANQTLILVDGRRLGDLSIQNLGPDDVNQSGQPDINGIPLASIERIEILSSTAGGIYGGNAVGGVVNIILRHDYRGLEVTANYQNTGDLKYAIERLDVTGGIALEGGKTNITFGGSISRSGVLKVGERPFSQEGFDLGYKNVPQHFIPMPGILGVPAIARGVNIYSYGGPLTLKPEYGGNAIGGVITNVPVGFNGSMTELGAALTANAGDFNLQQPLGNAGRGRSLLAAPEARSFNVNVRRKFNSWFEVYGDFSRFDNRGSGFAATGAPQNILLYPDVPTNPFEQPIGVFFDNLNLAEPYRTETIENRATAGLALHLPHHWAVGFDYVWNWSKSTSQYYQYPLDFVGLDCAVQGISPSNAGQEAGQCPDSKPGDTRPLVNLLVNPDFTPYVLTKPTNNATYRTELRTPSLRLSGPLFSLPGGPVNFAGYAQRNIAVSKTGYLEHDFSSRASDQPDDRLFTVFAPTEQAFNSFYGEVRIPFFSSTNARPMLQNLSLQLSVRHDSYKTTAYRTPQGITEDQPSAGYVGSFADSLKQIGSDRQSAKNKTTNYTVAGEYSPMKDVTFRGSFGTGYTQPTVDQVVTQLGLNSDQYFYYEDSSRGNTIQDPDYTLLSGGLGFDFKPETSKSYSFGFILTPHLVPGDLRFSVDYTRINKRNEITFAPVEDILEHPERYPGRLVRAPLTAEDMKLGYTGGIITYLNITDINLFKSSVSAVDYRLDYTIGAGSVGSFHVYAAASWQPKELRRTDFGQPSYNFSGFAGGPLKWRGNGGVDWTHGNLGVEYNAQYYGPYRVYDPNEDPDQAAFDIALQGSRKIRSQMYHDIYISYTLPASSGILHGVRITGGIQNLFDRSPPIVASVAYSQAGYSGYGDPRLRRFTLTLRKALGN